MKELLLFMPILMAFRYAADTGSVNLNRLLFLVVFGYLGFLFHLCRGKESIRWETKVMAVAAIVFAVAQTATIQEYLERAEAISRSIQLVLMVVPLGAFLVALTCRPIRPLVGSYSYVGMGMFGIALAGAIAGRLGIENVQGVNIEASGSELISRERTGIVFIGGVVPSATFIVIAMAAFIPALFAKDRRLRWISVGVMLVGLVLVTMTGTRGALGMFMVVGLAFAGGLVTRMKQQPRLSAIGVVIIALLVPVVYPAIFPYLDAMELNLSLEPLRRESQSSVFDLTGRVDIWDRGLSYFQNSETWLMGYGAGAEVAAGFSAELGSLPHPALSGREDLHSHNTVFNLLFSGGLVVTLPYLLLLMMALKRGFKHCQDPRAASVLAMLLAWVGIGIHESLMWPHIYFFYYVLFGIITELYMVTRELPVPSKVPEVVRSRTPARAIEPALNGVGS